MGDIAAELKTYLKTISGVTTLVGAGTAARIYHSRAKQGVSLPFIVYEVFAGSSAEYLNGIAGVATNRIEVVCYAATSTGAYSLAEAVRLAPLQMFRGTMGSTAVLATTANGGYERGIDLPEPGGNQRRYWITRDYILTYAEAVA